MNICIDMRPALSSPTGVGTCLLNLVDSLAKIDEKNHYHLFSSSRKQRYPQVSYGNNFRVHDHRWPVRVLNFAWNRLSWPPIESIVRIPLDVVHSPTPLLIPAESAHRITTVYDIFFHTHPNRTVREMKRDYSSLLHKHCLKSDAIITASEHTKQQLVEAMQIPASKIYPIHPGADTFFCERASEEDAAAIRQKVGSHRPYFLFVGTREPRKNLPVLLESFRNLKPDVDLILAGPSGWQEEEWRNRCTKRVLIVGYVTKSELRALYQGAVALVLPSIEEGFGLPLLEAMAGGTAVIASDIPVFHEVAKDAFFSFDPDRPEALRDAIEKVYSDPQLRGSLIEKGRERLKRFSWLETARRTLELYQNL